MPKHYTMKIKGVGSKEEKLLLLLGLGIAAFLGIAIISSKSKDENKGDKKGGTNDQLKNKSTQSNETATTGTVGLNQTILQTDANAQFGPIK